MYTLKKWKKNNQTNSNEPFKPGPISKTCNSLNLRPNFNQEV